MTSKKSPQVTPKPTQKSRKIKPLKSKEPRTPKELAPELKEKLLSATIENPMRICTSSRPSALTS